MKQSYLILYYKCHSIILKANHRKIPTNIQIIHETFYFNNISLTRAVFSDEQEIDMSNWLKKTYYFQNTNNKISTNSITHSPLFIPTQI